MDLPGTGGVFGSGNTGGIIFSATITSSSIDFTNTPYIILNVNLLSNSKHAPNYEVISFARDKFPSMFSPGTKSCVGLGRGLEGNPEYVANTPAGGAFASGALTQLQILPQ